jgi:hypothetical protein
VSLSKVSAGQARVLEVRRQPPYRSWRLSVDDEGRVLCPTCSRRLPLLVVLDHLGVTAGWSALPDELVALLDEQQQRTDRAAEDAARSWRRVEW